MSLPSILRTASPMKTMAALLCLLMPLSASAWWNKEWSFRKPITADAAAAGVTGDVGDTVVLVRLHEGVMKFGDANADGGDLRFIAEDDATPLKFHVEKFDPVFNMAFVWVHLPAVKAGAPVKFWLYYGNAKAAKEGDASLSYDDSQALVWHFSSAEGQAGQPPLDASRSRNNALNAAATDDSGLIGGSAKFDGAQAIGAAPSTTLNIAAGAPLTVSAWINPETADQTAVLFAQRDGGNALVVGLDRGAPYVEISDAAGSRRSAPAAAIAAASWHHLAVVFGGNGSTDGAAQGNLFVDGQSVATVTGPLPALTTTISLGADAAAGGGAISAGFTGEIDELQIAHSARSPGWLTLAANNQGVEDKLLQFGADEGLSGFSTGYVGIIMQSVTIDAWVIIGILALIALASYAVMYTKGGYCGRTNRANDLFTRQFQTLRSDLTDLESVQKLNEDERDQLEDSSLYRMYKSGIREILHRFEIAGRPGALSAESIESIRASVDATSVRENQRLSKGMVVLTIAISGGPFIGLLGTVVGVMITFASIAAAGEVNVNAIAPGISAALLATVAGMAVAIPALFAYNFLLGRIKDIQANMAVFVDEFVTRMAEMYPAGNDGHNIRAAVGHR